MSNIPTQLSPGVNVTEIDLTDFVPLVSSAVGGFAGDFRWGPANKVVNISSEKELAQTFGTPPSNNSGQAIDFFCAAGYLEYANQLKVVRTVGTADRNATSSGATTFLIRNETEWQATASYYNGSGAKIYARYPGVMGNSLKVVILDSNATDGLTTAATAGVGASSLTINGITGEVGDRLLFGVTGSYQQFAVTAYTGTATVNISPFVQTAIGSGTPLSIKSQWAYQFQRDPSTSDDAAGANGSNDEMNILVIDEDGLFTGVPGTVLESYENVSKAFDAKTTDGASNYYFDIINNQSKYILVDQTKFGALASVATPEPKSSNFSDVTLIGTGVRTGCALYSLSGATSSTNATDYLYTSGYSQFADKDTESVDLIVSGRASATICRQINDMVTSRADCIAFYSPDLADVQNLTNVTATANVLAHRNVDLNLNSSYAAMDSGWKYRYDKYNDRYIWCPLNPDAAGLCARTDSLFDPWYSPGGYNRGAIKSVKSLAWSPTKANRDTLYPSGVNCIVHEPGFGPLMLGDKTMLSKSSAFGFINVRRLFIVCEKAISRAAKSFLFELNDEQTRTAFRNLIIPFLRDVQGRRGITDFKVVCDETNNTAQVIDSNQFVADIYIKPARSINFIQLNFVATRSDATFTTIGG